MVSIYAREDVEYGNDRWAVDEDVSNVSYTLTGLNSPLSAMSSSISRRFDLFTYHRGKKSFDCNTSP